MKTFLAGLSILLISSAAHADFYLNPEAGIYVPISGGDSSYSLGAALGYGWTKNFSTEVSYARLFATGNGADGDLITGEGIYHWSFPFLTPYASVGAGTIHTSFPTSSQWDYMGLLGGGVTIGPLLFLSVGVGVTYGIVFGGDDYIEPAVSLGANF